MAADMEALAREAIQAMLTLSRETRSSIELTRNAKGDYQWVIKLYFDRDMAGEASGALAQMEKIDTALRDRYLPAEAA